jgi:hypothetical protein
VSVLPLHLTRPIFTVSSALSASTNLTSNIAALKPTILTALKELEMKTGLVGTVLLGGPEPERGGNISVFE